MDYKKIIGVLFVFMILGFYHFDVIDKSELTSIFNSLNVDSNNENMFSNIETNYNDYELLNSKLEVIFCPSDDCFNIFKNNILNAKSNVKCAFYELNFMNLSKVFLELSKNDINVEILVDDAYLEKEGLEFLKNSNIKIFSDKKRGTRYNNYMHHKFCVIDDSVVITGSANPTNRGFLMNDNNIIKIESSKLSKNYNFEFEQLKSGKFGYNKQSALHYNNLTLNYKDDTYLVNTYFCPQDDCDKEFLNLIGNAENEILFGVFAITYDELSDLLIEKNNDGVNVKGLIEKRNINLKGSDYYELNKSFNFKLDVNKYNMHNKFFVIDENIVITGSTNPSASGFNYNDENMIVIENRDIAMMYKNYFLSIY
ncbi:MAG: phospholipase D-like domain-containing protein [Nanoarchaeota archaeon]